MLSSKTKIIPGSWSLNTEYGSGMHIKHFLSTITDSLFLMPTSSALRQDAGYTSRGLRSDRRGTVPPGCINWDLVGSLNLSPLSLALPYFSMAVGRTMEIYVSFTLI